MLGLSCVFFSLLFLAWWSCLYIVRYFLPFKKVTAKFNSIRLCTFMWVCNNAIVTSAFSTNASFYSVMLNLVVLLLLFIVFLISESLMQCTKNSLIESNSRSDHSITTLDLNLSDFTHGKSYWKHNNSLLSDPEYLSCINRKIVQIKQQYALPIYNMEIINRIPNGEIQFTINDHLFLDTVEPVLATTCE